MSSNERAKRLAAYAKLLQGAIVFCAAIYTLVTGEKPPPARQVLNNSGKQNVLT